MIALLILKRATSTALVVDPGFWTRDGGQLKIIAATCCFITIRQHDVETSFKNNLTTNRRRNSMLNEKIYDYD